MNPQQLQQYLKVISDAVSPAGREVYVLALKQARLTGLEYLAITIVLLLLTALLGWLLGMAISDRTLDADSIIPLAVIFTVMLLGVTVLGCVSADYLLNPQYAAILSLLKAARGGQ